MQIGERVIEGHDQGARRGAAHLRGRKDRRPQDDARRAGAAQHVHDERRQHRTRTRKSSSRSSTRRRCATTTARSGCAFRWRSRRATSRAAPIACRRQRHGLVAGRRSSVLDADRITPPVVDRAATVTSIRSTIIVDLERRLPAVEARAAPITRCASRKRPGHRYHLTLADGPVPAARDFELDVDARRRRRTGRRAVHRDQGRQDLCAADGAAAGRDRATGDARTPREVTYIIDTSGSMEGVSIVQAREALLHGARSPAAGRSLQRHRVQFGDASPLFARARCRSTPARSRNAKQFVAGLRARGGTEMLPALEIALAGARESPTDAPGGLPHRRRRRATRTRSCA